MATDYVALLAERKQQPAAEAGPTDYVALAEQRKQQAFEEKEAKRHPVLRKAAQLGRGAVRGFGETAVGLTDLVGDVAEKVGLPRGPFAQNEDVQRMFPHSSGSRTEQAGEMIGDFFSLPGAGAGKTIASAAARAAVPAALYGAAHSEGEGLDRITDAAKSAVIGGVTAGALHGGVHGVGKIDPKAQRLEDTLNRSLGKDRLGGELPLAQRVDQSNMGGKMLAKAARRLNTGKRAVTAKDRSQRINDDVYRMQFKEAYKDIPGAVEAGEEVFNATRSAKGARKMGEKVIREHKKRPEIQQLKKSLKQKEMDLRHQQQLQVTKAQEAGLLPTRGSALTKTRHMQERKRQALRDANDVIVEKAIGASDVGLAKRKMLKKSIGMKDRAWGRFSADSTLDAGDAATSELMSPLRTQQASPDKMGVGQMVKSGTKFGAAPVVALSTGHPEIAALIGGVEGMASMLKKSKPKWKKAARGQFVERVQDLPQLKDPVVQRALLGDTKLQKQLQEAVGTGEMALVNDFLQRLTVTGED